MFGQPTTGSSGPLSGTPQNPLGASLFGITTQSHATATQTTSLHGSNIQTTTGTSLFEVPATSFGANAISTLLGGQPSTMSISPIQPTGPVLFSKVTRFNDLPEEMKKKFEDLEAYIQGRVQISNNLTQRKLGQEPAKGQDDIRKVQKELLSVIATVQSDVLLTSDLKEKLEQHVQDTIVATRVVDGFKNPRSHEIHLRNHASFPLELFTRVTKQLQERLQWYKSTIEQIERKLSSTVVQAQQIQAIPQMISSALQTQHSTFVSLAAKTASLDAALQKIKTLYTHLWRERMGSMRDPFNDLIGGTKGILQ